jgi:hypothetical protein
VEVLPVEADDEDGLRRRVRMRALLLDHVQPRQQDVQVRVVLALRR